MNYFDSYLNDKVYTEAQRDEAVTNHARFLQKEIQHFLNEEGISHKDNPQIYAGELIIENNDEEADVVTKIVDRFGLKTYDISKHKDILDFWKREEKDEFIGYTAYSMDDIVLDFHVYLDYKNKNIRYTQIGFQTKFLFEALMINKV